MRNMSLLCVANFSNACVLLFTIWCECHSRESKIVVFRTANFRSQGITFSHIESPCRKLRRTRVISCFELREMTQSRQRRWKAASQNFSKYRLTKKLWKFRLWKKNSRQSIEKTDIIPEIIIIRWWVCVCVCEISVLSFFNGRRSLSWATIIRLWIVLWLRYQMFFLS